MQFLPENDSVTPKELARAINELQRNLSAIDPSINKNCGKVEPEPNMRKPGKVTYADGLTFDPGSGEGIYYRNQSGNWVKL